MNVTEGERDETPASKPALGGSMLADILGDLSRNALDLVRGEIKLAAAETTWKVTKEVKSFELMTIGAGVAYAGFLLILTAAVIALSVVLPVAWAALILGAAALLAGTITMLIAHKRRRKEKDLFPRQAINTLREDAKWMRDQLT